MLRTHKISEVEKKLTGKKVELCGWVDSVRDFKSMIFIVLRDKYGKVQCIIPKSAKGFEDAKIFAVNDKKKYDPENKSKKAKPGKPGIYLE